MSTKSYFNADISANEITGTSGTLLVNGELSVGTGSANGILKSNGVFAGLI